MLSLYNLTTKRKAIIGLLLIVLMVMTFEVFQQYFYIKRFNILESSKIDLARIFRRQGHKWLIWLCFALGLVYFTKRKSTNTTLTSKDISQFIGLVLLLVILNIITISLVQFLFISSPFTFDKLLYNFIPFYTFQKGPIITLGYFSVGVILYYYYYNENLKIKVQELSNLKDKHEKLYNTLKTNNKDNAKVLSIKIGNKIKIIPIDNITSIVADDYCSRINTFEGNSFSARHSLKSLETMLGYPFIRVHRGGIVNMSYVKEFINTSAPRLVLKDGTELAVSQRKLKSVRDFFNANLS